MIALILVLLLASSLCLVVALCVRVQNLEVESKDMMMQDHAKCTALVAAFVGNEFAVSVLTAAAEDYDSIEGQADLRRLSLNWNPEDVPVPVLWMRERAERIKNRDSARH